ncbi:MAG: M23 family metallopeptidase [Anaerolineae bacterium]|nr:M23 family metallopeptidase [Anaerolineae bacterium]
MPPTPPEVELTFTAAQGIVEEWEDQGAFWARLADLFKRGLVRRPAAREVLPPTPVAELPLTSAEMAAEEWGPGHALWTWLTAVLAGHGPDRMSPVRLASHAAVVLVTLLAVLLSRMELPRWDLTLPVVAAEDQAVSVPVAEPLFAPADDESAPLLGDDFLARSAVPYTIIPERARLDPVTYTVQAGDTVIGIAARFKVSPDTVMWANGRLEDNPDLLKLGQQLIILPVSGVLHTVEKNDTVESIAKKYKATPDAVFNFGWNGLNKDNYTLQVGQRLIVPGGTKPYVERVAHAYNGPTPKGAKRGTGLYVWPASGTVTQKFWTRHKGIDIGAPTGAAVKASDTGFVAAAGWSNVGYGYYIIIDHGNGDQTLYAHLSRILVEVGQSVGKGARIGSVGNTGNSTGPHLHFEIRRQGVPRNPYGFLP